MKKNSLLRQRLIALIPARSGSKRIPGKNIAPLAGHPLIAYTIAAAKQSGIFSEIVVSTDSPRYARLARRYGAIVPFLRPKSLASARSMDAGWVFYTLKRLRASGRSYEAFAILRPTSPFRQPATIRRAWAAFRGDKKADSIRAVERCRQHPAKMWVVKGRCLKPLLKQNWKKPLHSCQYPSLPPVYAQNASLEIARTSVALGHRTIAGRVVRPFFTRNWEGFDINTPVDLLVAELLVKRRLARLPQVDVKVGPNPRN